MFHLMCICILMYMQRFCSMSYTVWKLLIVVMCPVLDLFWFKDENVLGSWVVG